MRTIEMKITIPEGARFSSVEVKEDYAVAKFNLEGTEENKMFERRIGPETFKGEWLNHIPTTSNQKMILNLYQDAKANGRLHAFTCMAIDPSIKDGKLVYEKGLKPAVGFSQRKWEKMLKEYDPSRNSRQMTRTEYACKCLFIIQELVKSGYEVDEAWAVVCDDSKKIGHYYNSDNAKHDFEPTGSRNVCGFYDLANAWKLLAEDLWDKAGGFWGAGGLYLDYSDYGPVAELFHDNDVGDDFDYGLGVIALD